MAKVKDESRKFIDQQFLKINFLDTFLSKLLCFLMLCYMIIVVSSNCVAGSYMTSNKKTYDLTGIKNKKDMSNKKYIINTPTLICREERPWEEYRHPYLKRCSQAGVKTIWVQWRTPITVWNKKAVQEYFMLLDKYISNILVDIPDGKIFFQVLTTVKCSPKSNSYKYDSSQFEVWPPAMKAGDRVSSVSQQYKDNTIKSLEMFGKHLVNSAYADRIAGLVVAGGNGEWFSYYDFSTPAVKDYQNWLKDKYKTKQALQRAWKTPDITFRKVMLPKWSTITKRGSDGGFFNPNTNPSLIDFFEYHHTRFARVASQFIATLKKATSGKYPIGMWGGGFGPVSSPVSPSYRKGKDANPAFEMMDDPNVDFFVFPYGYEERHAGGVFFRTCGSPLLRKKGQICEDDTRTPKTSSVKNFKKWEELGDNFGQAETNDIAVEILKRNFAGMFTQGGTGISWYSMGKGLWFDVPEIINAFGKFAQISKDYSNELSKSEIAIVFSKKTRHYQDIYNYNFSKQPRTIIEFARIGAPVTFYEIRDLLCDSFPFDKYKMYIFLDTYYLSKEERKVINEKVKKDNHVLLWYYASGYITDEGLSTQASSQLIDMKINTFGKKLRLEHGMDLVLLGNNHKVTDALAPNLRIVEPQKVAPVFWVDDDSAQILAMGQASVQGVSYRKPALCIKEMSDWTSIWCGISYLPASILRNIARMAGVHIYSDSGDQIFAGTNLFSLHAAYDGKRDIKFLKSIDVYDAFSRKQIYQGVSKVSIDLKKGQTILWILK